MAGGSLRGRSGAQGIPSARSYFFDVRSVRTMRIGVDVRRAALAIYGIAVHLAATRESFSGIGAFARTVDIPYRFNQSVHWRSSPHVPEPNRVARRAATAMNGYRRVRSSHEARDRTR